MNYNDFAASEYKRFMSDSIEEKIKQRIDECKKLDIHNTVRLLCSDYAFEQIEKLGCTNFGIDRIEFEETASIAHSIKIIKFDGTVYHFERKTKKAEKFFSFYGLDETTICLSVNYKIVFRSSWQRIYNMESVDYDSTDYPEEIISYIPGPWHNDLLAIIRKKRIFEEELYKTEAENTRIKKIKEDKENFGL